MDLIIEGTVVTDAGKLRSGNEDNYYLFGNYRYNVNVSSKKESRTAFMNQALAAVYDGMGGEEAGETASLIAARSFMPCKTRNLREEALHQVKCANEAVCREMKKRGGRIGTTAVILYINEGMATCCNVGDSRCYIMRDGILRQISIDHSEAENMVRMGVLKPEEARKSKSWHKLTQHLGIFPDEFVIEPYFSEQIKLQEGDVFLLCSDGLTDMVMDDEIAEILGSVQHIEDAAVKLVESALRHGGRDNVTAVVLRVCQVTFWQSIWEHIKNMPEEVWIILFMLAVAAVIIA